MNNVVAIESLNSQPFPIPNDGLVIDEIVEVLPGESAAGRTFVPATLSLFDTHFAANSLLPGVVQVQLLVDLAASAQNSQESEGHWELSQVSGARFRHPIVPGDTLLLRVRSTFRALGDTFSGEIRVSDRVVTRISQFSIVNVRREWP